MALEKILVVGKDTKTQQLARPFTKHLFAADDTNDIWEMVESVYPEMIILDTDIPHDDICAFLKHCNNNSIDIPVVIVGDHQRSPEMDRLIELGASEYIDGKENHNKLGQVIDKISNGVSFASQSDPFFSEECPSSVSIVGKSQAISRTLRMVNIVAQSSCNPVLIVGETGTGKELVARAVHILRHGSDSKFVAVNCAALTANLLESELFGHAKGSFTSADREKIGLLELAENGTIFLDEISEMPLALQAKLLRVLQEKTFRKVGGINDITCNATILTSSNKKLLDEVDRGTFRRDLYYRLSICPIMIAPLRAENRKEDILLLAEYFIKNSDICPEKKGRIKGLTKIAAETLKTHAWPGNVRELRNVIDRAIMLETSDKIGLTNLIIQPERCIDEITGQINNGLKDFSLATAEKELIAKALDEAGWQKTRAASLLGITRATLYAKVKQYNIQQKQNQKTDKVSIMSV